jgi:CheY-like chemotaxis protein
MLRRILGDHIQMEISLAPELCPIKADPAQIEQVVVNLAVNARDAMPGGGRLIIKTRHMILQDDYLVGHPALQPGAHVLLSVSDTGQGMSEEVQAHIFEPFFTTKEPGRGTGLGLATIFGIVKQSGGSIYVYSEEGIGTTFKVYFPCVAEAAPALATSKITMAPPSGNETILLVEDHVEVADLVRQVLQGRGYTVLQALTGQEALDVAAHHEGTIHLLLADVIMPGMDGRALAERLSRLRPGIKLLFMSGYIPDSMSRPGDFARNVAFLQKPFSPTTLAGKVRQVLDVP